MKTCQCPGACKGLALRDSGVACRVVVDSVGIDALTKARVEAREYLKQITGMTDECLEMHRRDMSPEWQEHAEVTTIFQCGKTAFQCLRCLTGFDHCTIPDCSVARPHMEHHVCIPGDGDNGYRV